MNLSSLIGLCSKQYHTTFPPLKQLNLGEFSQVDVKSISDFTFHTSVSRYQDSTIIKVRTYPSFDVFFLIMFNLILSMNVFISHSFVAAIQWEHGAFSSFGMVQGI
jgi:hypothetical protein